MSSLPPFSLHAAYPVPFFCRDAGIMILLPVIIILSVTAISSLNDYNGCASFHIIDNIPIHLLLSITLTLCPRYTGVNQTFGWAWLAMGLKYIPC